MILSSRYEICKNVFSIMDHGCWNTHRALVKNSVANDKFIIYMI